MPAVRTALLFPFLCAAAVHGLTPQQQVTAAFALQQLEAATAETGEVGPKFHAPSPWPAEREEGAGAAADEGHGDDEGDGDELSARQKRRRAGIDPCGTEAITGNSWIDRVNRGLHRAVCSSVVWFDDLFGNDIYEDGERGTYGRLLVGLEYDDREDLGDFTDFRAEYDLPKAERRLSGFIGRGDRDEIISDEVPRTGALPNLLEFEGDNEWLAGLGYRLPGNDTEGDWSIDVGADIEFPINWYTKARYKRLFFPTDASMFRYRQTFFWEKDDGWGLTSRADWDFLVHRDAILRWRNVSTFSEGDQGVDWYTELTLFQNIGERQALAYQLASSGETDADVPLQYVLGRVIYRRRIFREWLYLDVRPGVSYRRDEPGEDRELRPMLAVGVELLFGEYDRR